MCRCNRRCNSCNRNCTSTNCNCRNNNNSTCNCRNNNNSSCSSRNNSNSCSCNMYANQASQNNNIFPENYLYGHAYTPNQCMNRTFTPECGLENGTIFPELVSPYSPGQSIDFIEYLKNGGM